MRRRVLAISAVLAVVLGALVLWVSRGSAPAPASRPAAGGARAGAASDALAFGGASASPPPHGDFTIRGQVRGPRGPVAGATVVATSSAGEDVLSELHCQCGNECGQKLLECGCGEAAGQLMELVAERRGEAPPAARATTEGEGQFVLTGLAEGAYAVWAEAPFAGAGVVLGVRAGADSVVVPLGAGVEIAGTVTREDGRGVAGAVVTAIFAKHSRFFEVATSADGAFSLGPLPDGAYTVVASAAGLLPARERLANGTNRKVRLELAAPRTVSGRVMLESAPAVGATVLLHGEHKRQEIKAEREGAFAFRMLRPGKYELRANVADHVAQETVTVEKGRDPGGVTLTLRAGVRIDGNVVDETGAALSGVRVIANQIAPSRRRHVAVARSDANGRFRMGPLEPGEFELSPKLEGYLWDDDLKVTAVESASAELVLRRAQRIQGKVVDPEGRSVSDVWIDAIRRRVPSSRDDRAASTRSSNTGTFTLEVQGGEYDLAAHPEGFKDARLPVRAPAADVVLRLERGATIDGEVLDEDGSPVAAAEVRVVPRSGSEGALFSAASARTDRQGHFVITGLDAGPVVVVASKLGEDESDSWTATRAHARAVVPESGRATVRLRFEAGLAIAGLVVGPDGAGLSGTRVRAWASRPRHRTADYATDLAAASEGQTVTDAAGGFTIRGLTRGEHVLVVLNEDYDSPPDGVRAQAGDSNVRIVLSRGAVLRGRVVGDGGVPIVRFRLNGEPREAPDGRFAIPINTISRARPADGSRSFRFVADGYAPLDRTVSVTRGLDVDLGDLVLSRGRTVSGSVVDATTGAPIAAARVRPLFAAEAQRAWVDYEDEARPEGLVLTNRDGTFTVQQVGDGALLRVEREGYAPTTMAIGADPGPVLVRLGRGGAISVRLVSAAGEPIPAMPIAILGRPPGESETYALLPPKTGKTDAQGSYEASGLLPGTYSVLVASADRNPGLTAAPVVLRDGERVTIELRARAAGTTLSLSISGPGATEAEGLHVALVAGVVPPITRVQDLSNIGTLLQPRDGDPPDAPTFELLEPGPYTVLVATEDGDAVRVFTQPVEVGTGPRQQEEVAVPAELPAITR